MPDPRIRLEGEEVWRRGGSENAREYNVLGVGAVGGPSMPHPGPIYGPCGASRKAFTPPLRWETTVFQAGDRSTGGALRPDQIIV